MNHTDPRPALPYAAAGPLALGGGQRTQDDPTPPRGQGRAPARLGAAARRGNAERLGPAQRFGRMGRLGLSCAALALAASVALPCEAVGTRRFELSRAKDFRGGDLKGVAIDSTGRVHAGLNLGAVPIAEAQSIWATLRRSDGSILLGTGNEGKLLEVRGATVKVLAETQGLVIPALTEAWGGAVLLGTMPSGEVLKWQGGKLTRLAKLKDAEHVWALAYDSNSRVVYAGTGPSGKLYRIDEAGNAQLHFDAEEEHLMSVAVAQRKGGSVVFAGSSDRAKLYELRAPGRASVLYDFDSTEIRSLLVAADDSLYAVANEIKGRGSSSSSDRKGRASTSKTTGSGVLYRFSADGTPERLLESKSEHLVGLALDQAGHPYVGTGVHGRVYSVDDTHNDVLMADTEERMIGALALTGQGPFVASSDPAVLHPVKGIGGTDAVWTSRPLDAGLRAQFGRLDWDATAQLELSTRSGNTKKPDDTWSDWSKPVTEPGMVTSPAARYVQIRARWNRDPQAVLSNITLPFVTDNLRAVLTEVTVDTPSNDLVSHGDEGVGASGGPVTDRADPVVKLEWKVDNPDEDELRYRLRYKMLSSNRWVSILPPRQTLTKRQFDWDTSDLPEGRYHVRVEASDEISNPPDRVKKHQLQSGIVTVDNTPPAIVSLRNEGARVIGTAVDGVGPIARIEMSVAGTDEWYPFFPQDGIYDEQREDFDLNVSTLVPRGGGVVSIRVYDQMNNFVVRHVNVP